MLRKLQLVKSLTLLEVRKKENEERPADCIRLASNSSDEGEEVRLQSDTTVMRDVKLKLAIQRLMSTRET